MGSNQIAGQSASQQKRVALILGTAFEDQEAAVILDACRWTEYRDWLDTVTLDICGFHEVAVGRFGVQIPVDVRIEDMNPRAYDAIVIPGGFQSRGWAETSSESLYRVVREAHANGTLIVTLCVGVLPVAESGILEGGRATTYEFSKNHDNYARLVEFGCEPVHEPVVVFDNIISCSGPVYSEQVAHLMLSRLLGDEQADAIYKFRSGISPEYLA